MKYKRFLDIAFYEFVISLNLVCTVLAATNDSWSTRFRVIMLVTTISSSVFLVLSFISKLATWSEEDA